VFFCIHHIVTFDFAKEDFSFFVISHFGHFLRKFISVHARQKSLFRPSAFARMTVRGTSACTGMSPCPHLHRDNHLRANFSFSTSLIFTNARSIYLKLKC